MPPVDQIKFLPSGEVREDYGPRGDSYELDDGCRIGVRTKPVLCRLYDDFTDGEAIEGLEEIGRRLTDLRGPRPER